MYRYLQEAPTSDELRRLQAAERRQKLQEKAPLDMFICICICIRVSSLRLATCKAQALGKPT